MGFGFDFGCQHDSVEAYAAAVHFVNGGADSWYLGQPNFNTHAKLPGPGWTAFCAAGLWLWGSIKGSMALVMLTATAAIFLTYLLGVRTVGPNAALLAALLQATSSEVIEFSAVVFNPSVMPFLGTLLFLAVWRAIQRDHDRVIFWVAFLTLVMCQFHLSVLLLIPPILLVFWLSQRRVNVRWLAAGVLVGLLCYAPYVYGESTHQWRNTRGMLFVDSAHYSAEALKAFIAPAGFLCDCGPPIWRFMADEYWELCRLTFGKVGILVASSILSVTVALALITGMFQQGRESMRGFWRSPREAFARSPKRIFLVVCVLGPLACALMAGKQFQPRYALVLLAPLFCVAGSAAELWLEKRRGRAVFAILLCATVAGNAFFIPRLHRSEQLLSKTARRFVPTFENLELVDQSLRQQAGENRALVVEDYDFRKSLHEPERHWRYGADLIRPYAFIRNFEQTKQASGPIAPATYLLRHASEDEEAGATPVFRQNGIEIVASGQNRNRQPD